MRRIAAILSLVLLCFAVIFAPTFFGGTHVWAASVSHTVALILGLVMACGLVAGHGEGKLTAVDAAVGLFLGVVTVGYFQSPHEFLSRQELLALMSCGIFYLAVRLYLQRTWHLKVFVTVLVVVGTGISMYAIWQHFSESVQVLWKDQYPTYMGRASGTYICPNHFAGLTILVLPVALSLMMWGRLKPILQVLLGYSAVMMMTGLYFSYSRGGILALVVGLSVMLFLGMRRKIWALGAIVSVGIVLLSSVFLLLQNSNEEQWKRFTSAMESGEYSRPMMWRSAWEIFLDHPVMGVGPLMYDAWHAHYRGALLNRATYVHNDYLQLLCDYGIVGGVAMLFLVVMLLVVWGKGVGKYRLFSTRHENLAAWPQRYCLQRAMVIGVSGSWAAVAAHLVVDFDMHIFANALILSVMLGWMVSICLRTGNEEEDSTLPSAQRWVVAGILAVLLVGLAPLVNRNWSGDRQRLKAQEFENKLEWDDALKFYRLAVAKDPKNSRAWDGYLQLLYRRSMLAVIKKERWTSEFMKVYPEAAAADPMNHLWKVRKGEVHDFMKQFDEAEREFKAALEFDSQNPHFLTRAGLHYQACGKMDEAKGYFSRAAQLGGDEAVASENLKEIRMDQ